MLGPIVPVLSWSTEYEVVRRVNNNEMGLGASIWSQNTSTANRLALQMQAGTVWINCHGITDPTVPFSGSKQSGMGSEWGVEGLQGFCNMQTLHLKKE
jgi:acyl-CoA reductase-like NAD-dependent aldehyde dehydrogenase